MSRHGSHTTSRPSATCSARTSSTDTTQDDALKGRAAVVKDWVENKDEAGQYDAKYQPAAIDGDTYVATGWSRYFENGELHDEYFNVYFIKFDADGRATEFTEYWIQNQSAGGYLSMNAAAWLPRRNATCGIKPGDNPGLCSDDRI